MPALRNPLPLGHEPSLQSDIGTLQGDIFGRHDDASISQGDTRTAQGDTFPNKATFLALDTVTSVTSPTQTQRIRTANG